MPKANEIIDLLVSDLAWRKHEVSTLLLSVGSDNEEVMKKSLILLLYAHWEGYVKNIFKQYILFIADRSLPLNELTDNFKAIHLKGLIGELDSSKHTLTLSNELKFMNKLKGEKVCFSVKPSFSGDKDKSIINTTSNLSYKILESFLEIGGLGKKPCLALKKTYIDKNLLGNRNIIAHGSIMPVDSGDSLSSIHEIKKLKSFIFCILDSLKDDVSGHIEKEFYLMANSALATQHNSVTERQLSKNIDEVFFDKSKKF